MPTKEQDYMKKRSAVARCFLAWVALTITISGFAHGVETNPDCRILSYPVAYIYAVEAGYDFTHCKTSDGSDVSKPQAIAGIVLLSASVPKIIQSIGVPTSSDYDYQILSDGSYRILIKDNDLFSQVNHLVLAGVEQWRREYVVSGYMSQKRSIQVLKSGFIIEPYRIH